MPVFKLNDQAPDFTLPSISGGTHNFKEALQTNSDHWQLVIYFRGSWCPACREELEDLEGSKSYFDKHQIQVTTVTHDDKEELEKMVDELGLSFPVLLDEDWEFLKSYDVHLHGEDAPYEDHGTHGDPAYFLMDENGKVLYQQRQTSPFGRPHANELRKIIKYIRNNLK
ncbi:AhpC/TSA family protein [Halobacillus fulvus]|nr:AhpC/TSA family protein [Halobacillus fulvus]